MRYIGIDPGQKGAIAILAEDSSCQGIYQMPGTEMEIVKLLRSITASHPCMIGLEKAQSMPKQGVSSTFKYGKGFGFLIGCIMTLGIRHEQIPPQTWKKAICEGMPKGKDASVITAERLWPDVELAPGRCRKPQDGLSDALCIAEHMRRKYPQLDNPPF